MKNKKFSYDGRSRPSNDTYKKEFNRIFNPTLTKNMPNVKWDQLPPRKGPNSNGIQTTFCSRQRFATWLPRHWVSQSLQLAVNDVQWRAEV